MWDAGWAAMKVGAAGFVVPFMFVYEPALLMIGDLAGPSSGALSFRSGIGMLAAGLHGFLPADPMPHWERGVAIGSGPATGSAGGLTTDIT